MLQGREILTRTEGMSVSTGFLRRFSATTLANLFLVSGAVAQTVSAPSGNVLVKQNGRTIQITSLGLDLDPSLSSDRRLVVFVRRTPNAKIFTGAGEMEGNELWIAETSA